MTKQPIPNKMKIQTTTVTQSSNELLGTESKILYYLIITNDKGEKVTLNVGQKTHESIKKLNGEITKEHIEPKETHTKRQTK